MVNGLCIYGGEKMNKAIFDLNKIVDEIVSMTKKRIDVYIEEKRKELTEELELKEIEKFMNEQCKVCKKYKGDCGHHFKDDLGHINYDIPSEYACDPYGNCVSFEETRTKYQIALTNILDNGSKIKIYVNTQS